MFVNSVRIALIGACQSHINPGKYLANGTVTPDIAKLRIDRGVPLFLGKSTSTTNDVTHSTAHIPALGAAACASLTAGSSSATAVTAATAATAVTCILIVRPSMCWCNLWRCICIGVQRSGAAGVRLR